MNKIDAEWIKKQYDILNKPEMAERLNSGDNKLDGGRNEYQRDYARILYSSSFRRLQGKMQLLGIENDQFFRNRLTHSLEVSQIAEGIVNVLNDKLNSLDNLYEIYGNGDMYVLRGACLAHDLGNPPFGHCGEVALNELTAKHKGFEGNAQTIRILKSLEKKSPNYAGLNLTKRTLFSVLKYNVNYETAKEKNGLKSKFIYDEDFNFYQEQMSNFDLKNRTLDVQIMDLADEIAYSAHDLEDCLSLKIFDIDEFFYEFKLLNSGVAIETVLNTIITESKEEANKCNRYGSSEEYKDILKKSVTSKIVDTLIKDIGVIILNTEDMTKIGVSENKQLGFQTLKKLAKGLKDLTFKCLKRKKHVKIYEAKGKIVLNRLFNFYLDNFELMSTEYVDLIEQEIKDINEKEEIIKVKIRYILDYISGMMDSYALKKYNEFFGEISLKDLSKLNDQIKF